MPRAITSLASIGDRPRFEVEEALVRVGLELGQQRRRGAVQGAGQARHLVEVGGHFLGLHQIDATSVDTASGSPLRSVIMPRVTGIGRSRIERRSPWSARNSWSWTWR